jgi:hypothetical protein
LRSNDHNKIREALKQAQHQSAPTPDPDVPAP